MAAQKRPFTGTWCEGSDELGSAHGRDCSPQTMSQMKHSKHRMRSSQKNRSAGIRQVNPALTCNSIMFR